MKKILAGRGAVDYYLNQTRRGLADYYLAEPDGQADGRDSPALSAPGSSWWGGGTEALGLDGEVARREFMPLYAKGARPDGGYLGRRFRLPEEADAAKKDALLAASEIRDPYERWMARHEIRRGGGRASVAAWDCTFSPPKSVSLLWAAGDVEVQRQVWAAHVAAVDAGLGYLQAHAGYVRAGAQGVRVLDTSGLVVARMNEWTSRDGDMHLHTHCVILNRAQTLEDGKWRALDGRALLTARTGAGALYQRSLEAELTRRLGVAWRDRRDGLRELDGVDDELIVAFSSRRRAITSHVAELAGAYRDKYGADPPPAVLNAMGQTAWATTRRHKQTPDPAELLERWEDTARQHGRQLAALPHHVTGRAGTAPAAVGVGGEVDRLLARLAEGGRASFSRHDLVRAALDVLPPGEDSAEVLRGRADGLVDTVLRRPELVGVTVPDPIVAPADLQRRDGTSVYTQPSRQRWALQATLDREAWLLDVAPEPTGRHINPDTLEAAVVDHGLGDDQADAVRDLLGQDRRVGLLIGPAGAGKTRTLRAVVDAWHHTGGEVVGLTVSQAAAQVLTAEAHVRAENTAKWLHETARGRWTLPSGALVLIDEASMVSTDTLVQVVAQARKAGGRVLLVGDPAQLAAIHIGGAFDLLADRYGAARLHEIRRFTAPWEADASRLLRRRDPAALAEYAMRARIHGGPQAQVESGLFEAWQTDALTHAGGSRASVLMIVATNDQAAVLAERARHTLIGHGAVVDGPTVQLRDNLASVGDHIVTRRNDRRLITSNRGWVVNGDVWTVLQLYPDGAADARRHTDGATITLPADYLADHTHLGYATTAHRAQGMTVDICHAAITATTTHESLYVAATRGRHGNHLWVATDTDRDLVADPDDLPAPEHLLSRILERRDPGRLSAHQAIDSSDLDTLGLARIGQVFEDAARTATQQWLHHTLTERGLADAADDPEWPALVTATRQAALAGHDPKVLLDQAVRLRPIGDAHSTAAVLHWRLSMLTDTTTPARARGPLASLPPTDEPAIEVARQAGDLMRQRWRHLRAILAQTTEPLAWAPQLGAPPVDVGEQASWLTAAVAVTAYRERYELPDHTTMLGPRPAATRPDAQAAWDHAQLQADRYLARRLHDLTDTELEELDARQQAIITNPPTFDPARLEEARRAVGRRRRGDRSTGLDGHADANTIDPGIHALEDAARRHQTWRSAATQARDLRRQITQERATRHARQHDRSPTVRPRGL